MSHLPAIPINALFDLSGAKPNPAAGFDVQQTIRDAEVILGRDVMTEEEFIVFGRGLIERIANGELPEGAPTLVVALDREPDDTDLDRLLALVESIKGRHDFRRAGE